MNVMICFEISARQEEVQSMLAANGYMSTWKVKRGREEKTYHLPSNAMWSKGERLNPVKAKEDLEKVAKKLNVKIIRALALVVTKWDGIVGSALQTVPRGDEESMGSLS
jgi:hypothetical protein